MASREGTTTRSTPCRCSWRPTHGSTAALRRVRRARPAPTRSAPRSPTGTDTRPHPRRGAPGGSGGECPPSICVGEHLAHAEGRVLLTCRERSVGVSLAVALAFEAALLPQANKNREHCAVGKVITAGQ